MNWQPIETAPIEKTIIVWTDLSTDEPYFRARLCQDSTWRWYDEWDGWISFNRERPTHWLELTPPE